MLQATFEGIYHHGNWSHAGGGSGPGSSLLATMGASRILFHVIMAYSIRTMIDAPCGAMVWQAHLLPQLYSHVPEFKYLGYDIVPTVVEGNRQKFNGTSYVSIEHADLAVQRVAKGYDLIFSRDALQHVPLDSVWQILWNFAASDARWVLVGSYPCQHHELKCNQKGNVDIKAGEYFSIDLAKTPF